jgi:hypothetical protein
MADQITKLKDLAELLEKGLISRDEFEEQKSQLLTEGTQNQGSMFLRVEAGKVLPWVLGIAIVLGLFFVLSSDKEKNITIKNAPVLPFIYGL